MKSGTSKDAADKLVKGIKRKTRKHYSAEEKIRIVLAGLRGEESIAVLCRREGISESLYYTWSASANRCDDQSKVLTSCCKPVPDPLTTPSGPSSSNGIQACNRAETTNWRRSCPALCGTLRIRRHHCFEDITGTLTSANMPTSTFYHIDLAIDACLSLPDQPLPG